MAQELPPFEFGIQRIQDCGFSIEEAVEPKHENMRIGYGMNFLFDVKDSWIQYTLRADFREKDTNSIFITGTVLTRFSVNKLSQFNNEDDKVIFPGGSIENLFGIAFGHLRAIMAKNISGVDFLISIFL